jgi:hypothetical protein
MNEEQLPTQLDSKQPEHITQSNPIELTDVSDPPVNDTETAQPVDVNANVTADETRYLKGWKLYLLTLG